MGLVKRWTSGLVSRIDWMVTKVENHEALVSSAIRDTQQSVARAKVQLGRVQADGARLRRELDEEKADADKWRSRAKESAASDESAALECLRRSKRASARAGALEQRLEAHARTEQQLRRDIRAVADHLAQLREKRDLMRTRQSRAKALSSARSIATAADGGLDDVFERWEEQVTEAELEGDCELANDDLEHEFVTKEEEDELRAELTRLCEDTE